MAAPAYQGTRFPVPVQASDVGRLDCLLLNAISDSVRRVGVGFSDLAVLTSTGVLASQYRRLLTAHGIPSRGLVDGDVARDAVAVGTVYEAQGHHFAQVFVPRPASVPRQRGESDAVAEVIASGVCPPQSLWTAEVVTTIH